MGFAILLISALGTRLRADILEKCRRTNRLTKLPILAEWYGGRLCVNVWTQCLSVWAGTATGASAIHAGRIREIGDIPSAANI